MNKQPSKTFALALIGGALLGLCASAHAVHNVSKGYMFDHGTSRGTNPGLHEHSITMKKARVVTRSGEHPALITQTTVRARDPGWDLRGDRW